MRTSERLRISPKLHIVRNLKAEEPEHVIWFLASVYTAIIQYFFIVNTIIKGASILILHTYQIFLMLQNALESEY